MNEIKKLTESIKKENIKKELNEFIEKYQKDNIININVDLFRKYDNYLYEMEIQNDLIFDSVQLYYNDKKNDFFSYLINIISYYILYVSYKDDMKKLLELITNDFEDYKSQLIEELDSTFVDRFDEDYDVITHLNNGLYVLNAIRKKIKDNTSNEIVYTTNYEINKLYSDNIADDFFTIKNILNKKCIIDEFEFKKIGEYFEKENPGNI